MSCYVLRTLFIAILLTNIKKFKYPSHGMSLIFTIFLQSQDKYTVSIENISPHHKEGIVHTGYKLYLWNMRELNQLCKYYKIMSQGTQYCINVK